MVTDRKSGSKRMSAVSEKDLKLLWGRAAGICSNPGCRQELTSDLERSGPINLGEMAHVIARQPAGPRGDGRGGDNSYGNLILLCPTCHAIIDKAPEDYPAEKLREWKRVWEAEVRNLGSDKKFETIETLKSAVMRLLIENHQIWADFGPNSEAAKADPGSNLETVWRLKKLDTIIPNNIRIVNMIESNEGLLNQAQYALYSKFKSHAAAFERNQYHRLDTYPLFPSDFDKEFRS
jgi:hypothetical protein